MTPNTRTTRGAHKITGMAARVLNLVGLRGSHSSFHLFRSKCKEGDLTRKFGNMKVGREEGFFTKSFHTDVDLELPELDGHRSVYLVLYEEDSQENFLACAKINPVNRKLARASFAHEGVRGAMIFNQVSSWSQYNPVRTSSFFWPFIAFAVSPCPSGRPHVRPRRRSGQLSHSRISGRTKAGRGRFSL